MTRNNESHRFGHFFTNFFSANCIRRSVALPWLVYLLHSGQCAFYCSAICWCSFKILHNQCTMQPERFQLTNASWWSFSHIKVIYFRTSPNFHFIQLISFIWKLWLAFFQCNAIYIRFSNVIFIVVSFATMSLPLSLETLKEFVTLYFPLNNNPFK